MEEITSEQNEIYIEFVRFLQSLVEDTERIVPENRVIFLEAKMVVGCDEDAEAVRSIEAGIISLWHWPLLHL